MSSLHSKSERLACMLTATDWQVIGKTLLKAFSTSAISEIRAPPMAIIKPDASKVQNRQPQEDLVNKILSPELMSSSEELKLRLRQLQHDFQRAEGDTGSTEVQVAQLTAKIHNLSEHIQSHRKDFSTRRGLEGMINQRRKLLQYLRKNDFERYSVLLVRLGLKDSFMKQDRFMVQHQEGMLYKQKLKNQQSRKKK